YQLGKTHRLLGNKEPCLKNLSIALEVWDKLVPKDHPYPGLARRQMSACYIESGDLAEREHVAEMLANECRTLIRSNHYDPDILSFANIVNQYHTYIGVEDKLGILSQFLVKVFRFKYGDFFAPMIPHLQYLSRISGFSTTGLNQWVRDIGNVNDYNIRVEDFPHTTLTGAGAEPIVTLLRKWMSLPEDEASFSLNRYDLPFFKTFYLLEIRLSQDVPYSLYLLSNGEEIYILNSTNEPIYFVAGRDLIFEPALVSRYIVFFLDAVFGRYGRYIIIQEDKDLEWSCSNKMTEAMREAAKARIFPLELREQNENGMDFYCACIWFLDGFFTSGIHVAPNGVIEFKDTDCWDENSGVIYDMFLPQKRNSFKFIDHLRDLENFLRALMPDDVKAPAQLSSFSLLISHLHTVKSSPIYLATLPKTMLTEEEKIGLFHQLFSPEQAVDAVDQHDVEEHVLPFSKEFKLYVLNHRSLRQSSLCFFNGKESLVLDWTNEAFYDLAEKDFIFEPEAIHRYVLLFYDLVRGKFGRFTILEDPREYYFLTENYSEEDLQKVKDSIKPMVLKSQTDEEMVFSTQSVLFRNSLFSADIHVTNKGIVSIENEVDIYHNIRIIPVIYRGLQDLSKKTLFEVRRSIAELPGMLPQEQELNNLIIKEYLAQFLWEIQNETEHYIYF
ncbi:MAG TPA: tetratricopeptide repeat protein, partial [Puia sp.]